MKKYLRDYLTLFSIAGTIVIIDQITKRIIQNNLAIGEVFMPDFWLSQYVRLVNWHNTGAAFGLFQNMSLVFTILAIIVAIVIIIYYPSVPRHEWALRLAMSMQLGGALGNLIDRLRQGYVTDFVSVGNFPVFNVADASISIGCVVLFVGLWISEQKQKEIESTAAPDSQNHDSNSLNVERLQDNNPRQPVDSSYPINFSSTSDPQELKEVWSEDEEYQP